jgi:hypothetical protein
MRIRIPTSIFLQFLFISSFSQDISSQDLREEVIKANVPNQKEFAPLLKRDLIKYFSNANDKAVDVSYELLRNEPSQIGVAYPKFYLWVIVSKNGKATEQGAVRVAAIEKKQFEVTDYLSKEDIQRSPLRVYKIFPRGLCDKILEKANP